MSIIPMRTFAADTDTVRFFEKHPLFEGLPTSDLAHLARHAHAKRFSRRQIIWSPQDPAASLNIVRSGVVRISRVTPNDRELTLYLLGRRESFGEEGLRTDANRTTRAVAHEDVILYALHRDHLQQVMDRHARIGLRLIQEISQRRERLDRRTASVAYMTARARVASVLLELAETFGVQDSRGTIVNVRLTHREMAALIGATRETVSFAILAFRKAGIIETEGKRVVLLDTEALFREAEEANTSR